MADEERQISGQTTGQSRSGRITGWRSSLIALPGIGPALLPVGLCPACWPAYAGILSSLGLGFLMKTAYLMPLTILFLTFTVGALGFRAKRRRGYGPFVLGLIASTIAVTGKFILMLNPFMYGGIAVLVGASLWNGWPQKKETEDSCPACVQAEPAVSKEGSSDPR